MIFVTQDDIDARNAIMKRLGELWRVRYTPMGPLCHYNFGCRPIESHLPRIIMDITRRDDTMDQLHKWGGIFYQESQWLLAKKSVDDNPGTIFIFVPRCLGVLWAMVTTTFEHDGREKARPRGRYDKNSNDWCVKLLKDRFKPVTEKRPWKEPDRPPPPPDPQLSLFEDTNEIGLRDQPRPAASR